MIVQEILASYRLPFYERLRETLAADGIGLRLIHGTGSKQMATRRIEANLGWAEVVDSRRIPLGWHGAHAVWQPVLRAGLRDADLVVVEHANRQLVNYPLLLGQAIGRGPRVAFWGHGANLQATRPDSARERFKSWVAGRAHWWFAYTQGSADRVVARGFPSDRVTVVNNAVDTSAYPSNPEKTPRLCVFLGSLHGYKRIPFLLEAAEFVARELPGFTFTVIGAGEDAGLVEAWQRDKPWASYPGAVHGAEMIEQVSAAELMLMPGLVGLAANESFGAGTPIVTTDVAFHSPEIEYLQHDHNSVVLPATATSAEYAGQVAALLRDPQRIAGLRRGCAEAAGEISLDAMVTNFADGIRCALG